MSSEKGTGLRLVGCGFAAGFLLGAGSAWMLRWGAITGSAFLSGFQCGKQTARCEPQVGYGETQESERREEAEEDAAARAAEDAFRQIQNYTVETAYRAVPNAAPQGSDGL